MNLQISKANMREGMKPTSEGKPSKIRNKISTIVLGFGLIAIVALTGVNMYLALQYNQRLSDLGFENYRPNSTALVVPQSSEADLGKPLKYLVTNTSQIETVHYGTLHVSIQVLNSHYGSLAISLEDFNLTLSKYLDPGKLNETRVTYASQNESQTLFLAPGINRAEVDVQLKAEVYPNSEMLPSEDESIQLTLGALGLRADFFDFETQVVTSSAFSADISVTLASY